MEHHRFDDLTRALATGASRRGLLRGALAALGGVLAGGRAVPAGAACPPEQVERRGMGCVCKTTGRPPNADGHCPCPSGLTRCGTICVDTAGDPAHCGGCAAACPPDNVCRGGACGCRNCTVIFAFTGGAQSWTVPAGVTRATFDVHGAQGGDFGGFGGRAAAALRVAAGQSYEILVGGRGIAADGFGDIAGFNGGGGGAAGGGGASAVRLAGSPLVVAGGGGGTGGGFSGGPGGAGGGSSGLTGGGTTTAGGGGGGTASGGGAAGPSSAGGGTGTAGDAGQGGAGGAGAAGEGVTGDGGGGGGGLFGGGGGGGGGFLSPGSRDSGGGGGGGSGFITSGALSVIAFETGVREGFGRVTVTYSTR